jgi:hypothetical protein
MSKFEDVIALQEIPLFITFVIIIDKCDQGRCNEIKGALFVFTVLRLNFI